MAKKKNKKKSGKINPHKIGEMDLINQINSDMNTNRISDAYGTVKVLLERFDTESNRALFQTVFGKKLQLMEENGQFDEMSLLISEAKNRFRFPVFADAEEFVKVRNLKDDELIVYYSTRDTIPENLRARIADYLFFSEKKEKAFIQKHKEYKDVFFVKEAFADGFNPEKTKKLMVGIGSHSPYKNWVLLRKAIEAFYENDFVTLELLSTKIEARSFPRFLTEKLFRTQQSLEGKIENMLLISDEDKAFFKMLCGEDILAVIFFKRLARLLRENQAMAANQLLPKAKILAGGRFVQDLNFFFQDKILDGLIQTLSPPEFMKQLNKVHAIEADCLNNDHLLLKLMLRNGGYPAVGEDLANELIASKAISSCKQFKPEILKAELYNLKAMNLEDDEDAFFRNFYDPLSGKSYPKKNQQNKKISFLEESIKLSQHKPKIFKELIEEYRKKGEKTSKINAVLDKFLQYFPENPDGYKLAGDIALQNKAFVKAIGFYEKAYELMPLHRDFATKIIHCYSGIIEKRDKKTGHLIQKDLEKAEAFVNTANKTAVLEFNLLKARALWKKLQLNSGTVDESIQEIIGLFEKVKSNSFASFKYLLVFDNVAKNDFLTSHLAKEKKYLIDHFESKEFPQLLEYYLTVFGEREKKENRSSGTLFFDLLSVFLKNEKKTPTLALEDLVALMELCLKEHWNRLYIAVLCLAKNSAIDAPQIDFLMELIQSKISIPKIKQYLFNKKTIAWFVTKPGGKILSELAGYNMILEDIEMTIEEMNEEGEDIEAIIEELTVFISGFTFYGFVGSFLNRNHPADRTSLEVIEKLFGYRSFQKKKPPQKPKKSMKQQPKPMIKEKKPEFDSGGSQLDFFDLSEDRKGK